MHNSRERINAITCLKQFNDAAGKMAESAASYHEMLSTSERPKVEIGGFYRTYDGSFVYVARPRHKNTCPQCGGNHPTPVGGPLAILFGPGGLQIHPPGSVMPEVVPPDAEDAIDEFVVVILKGGHGIKQLNGEEPGDGYPIDKEGLVIDMPQIQGPHYSLSAAHLGMIGLCLKHRVAVSVGE